MHRKMMILMMFSFWSVSSFAQFEFGFKAGLSSMDLVTNPIMTPENNGMHYELIFNEASYGHHFGVYTRLEFLGMYLEPSVLFNSFKTDYTLNSYSEIGVTRNVFTESYRQINVPVMFGMRSGFFRMYLGPVMNYHLGSSSQLFTNEGIQRAFKESTYGYMAGIGLDIWKLRVDVSYMGNLSSFGDEFIIGGQSYSFSDRASRIMATVGYRF
jgi:hypothetical protein